MDTATAASTEPAARAARRSPLYAFSVVVVVAVLLLIKVGALVTSTNSGLAYISWPLADGQFWPEDIKPEGRLEMGHRYWAMAVGLLTIGLAVAVWLKEPRRWLRGLAIGMVVVVSLQGWIGRSGVFTNLPTWSSAAHGVLAQVLLCSFTVLAFALSPAWDVRCRVEAATTATARRLATVALGLVFAQVVVGAVVRHAKDQSASGLLWLHVGMAFVVALAILIAAAYAAGKLETERGFQRLLKAISFLLLAQISLGFAALAVRGGGKWTASPAQVGRALTLSGHVVCGALTMLSATLLCAKTWRNLRAGES